MIRENVRMKVDRMCPPSIQATPSYKVNLMAPIGVPFGMGCTEMAGDGPTGANAGIVRLPGSTTREVALTWAVPPEYDFYVDRVMIALWSITNEGGATESLTYIEPDNISVPSEVRIRWYDSNLRSDLNQQDILWGLMYGDGRNPFPLICPWVLRGGWQYQAFVRNVTALPLAISVTLWGRYRRSQAPIGDWSSSDRILLDRTMAELAENGVLNRGIVSSDPEETFDSGGLSAVFPLTQTGAPLVMAGGSVPIPTTATRSVNTTADAIFLAHQLMGRQYITPAEGAATQFVNGNTLPVMVQVYDERQHYWLNNVPIPMAHLVGDGRQPNRLPVAWSWGRSAAMTFQFWNQSLSIVNLNVDTEGWLRRASSICP